MFRGCRKYDLFYISFSNLADGLREEMGFESALIGFTHGAQSTEPLSKSEINFLLKCYL